MVKLVITDQFRHKRLRCKGLAISCAGILYGEYRLYPAGLLNSISAALLAGLAAALYASIASRPCHTIIGTRRVNFLYCCSGFAMTATWAYRAENTSDFWRSLEFQYAPIVVVNAFSTAWAITLGKSFLFPIYTEEQSSDSAHNASGSSDAIVALALTGIIGCAMTLTLRRSYMSWLQVFAFFVALLCISAHDLLDVLYSPKWNHRGYALLAPLSRPHSMDSESIEVMKSAGLPYHTNLQRFYQVFSLRLALIGLTVSSIWVLFLALNFEDKLHVFTTRKALHLDFDYMPSINTELVISTYSKFHHHSKRCIFVLGIKTSIRRGQSRISK